MYLSSYSSSYTLKFTNYNLLLYSKIDLLESKIKEKDTLFLKSIGIDKPKSLILIEIEPVVDIYTFVNNGYDKSIAQNSANFELVKLLAEDGDIKKIINDKVTSKNYSSHKILIRTKGFVLDSRVIVPILNFLNQFIEEELQAEVTAYFKTVDIADLEAANAYFEGDFSMEELELMHIQFLSDVGN